MRDYHDAKAMAQSLREALGAKQINVSHGESLELISKALGAADWNTLSAALSDERAQPKPPAALAAQALPAFPIRDFVPFPAMQFPMVIGRQRTMRALTEAFAAGGEVVMVAQRETSVDEPAAGDVYGVGVVGRVIDVGPVSIEKFARRPELKGATQVLLQAERRVRLRTFLADGDWYRADVDAIDEGAFRDAPDLIGRAATAFEQCRASKSNRLHDVGEIVPPLGQLHNPGRIADIIAVRLTVPVHEKQAILETADPVSRLERVVGLLTA